MAARQKRFIVLMLADRNHWGFVEKVFRNPEELRETLSGTTYETETRGERHLPEARPVGEGVYGLVRQGRSAPPRSAARACRPARCSAAGRTPAR